MEPRFVGVDHDFHDRDYARDWAARFLPSPGRLALFDTMVEALREKGAERILELGTGPGYFAEHLLDALPHATYEGLDFSRPMLDLARGRLERFAGRTALLQADLMLEDWGYHAMQPDAIVSTWALHDLGGEAATYSVYRSARALLDGGGLFLNGDFVKPDGSPHEFEPGRFPVARHLELLRGAGFERAQCLGRWEEELLQPTTAQNYACLLGQT